MTLQEQYNSIKSGNGNKDQFLKQARSLFPQYFNQYTDFNTAANVLKSKQIISEAAGGVVSKGFDIFDWKKILAEEVKAEEKETSKEVKDKQAHAYDNSDTKNADNINFNEIMKGFYAEMRDEKNAGKTGDEIKAMVVKNLAKDPLFYTKDGMFGVKGLGYTDEAPSLGKNTQTISKNASILGGRDEVNSDSDIVKNSLVGSAKKNVQDSLGNQEAETSMPKKVKEMPDKGVTGVEKKMKLQEGNLGHNETWSLEPEGRFWILTYSTMDGKKEKTFDSENEAKNWIKQNLDEVRGGGNYGMMTISTKGGGGGKRFVPPVLALPGQIFNRFANSQSMKDLMVFEDGTLYVSGILYNNLMKGANNPYILDRIKDIPQQTKILLTKSENYKPFTLLKGKSFKQYFPFKAPVEMAKEDKFNKAGDKQYWAEGDFLFPNLNKEKYSSPEENPEELAETLRESIEKDLAQINKEAEHEALQNKLDKVQALIDKKQSQINRLDEDEDMKDLTDAKKVKEISKDIKALEKAKSKIEKMMHKGKGKKKEVIDEVGEEGIDMGLEDAVNQAQEMYNGGLDIDDILVKFNPRMRSDIESRLR
jgi:hypothetical protein